MIAEKENIIDVAIIGGGLAGLSLSIQLAKKGFSVVVFEKESYPHHKVCGEYISMESHQFLKDLGLLLEQMSLPKIDSLELSAPSGKILKQKLTPGGFGISRFLIDNELHKIALHQKVIVNQKTKVHNIIKEGENFKISATGQEIKARVVVGAYGKRGNIDIKLNREFIQQKAGKLNNYIGIKYHIEYDDQPENVISLHNFDDGYCGISRIEENKYCLCYLTTANNLKRYGNSISSMEENVLHKNPHLKKIFTEAKFLWDSPITISQISFDKKSQVEESILMAGDSAGMITPLCGNGMSMALQASKILYQSILPFLDNKISREMMEFQYVREWNNTFNHRLRFGRNMQRMFGKVRLTNAFLTLIKPFPFISKYLVSKSHGGPF